MNLKERSKQAAMEGLFLAVKYGILIAVLLFGATDYMKTRAGADLGVNAFRYLEAGVKAGKLPADWAKANVMGVEPTSVPKVPAVMPSPSPAANRLPK